MYKVGKKFKFDAMVGIGRPVESFELEVVLVGAERTRNGSGVELLYLSRIWEEMYLRIHNSHFVKFEILRSVKDLNPSLGMRFFDIGQNEFSNELLAEMLFDWFRFHFQFQSQSYKVSSVRVDGGGSWAEYAQ